MINITNEQWQVLINILGAVETGGQIYGQRRYDDYTEAYTNSSAENSITIGAFQEFNWLAKGLLQEIKDKYPATFAKYDNADISGDLKKSSWDGYNPRRGSAKANAIVNIINSPEGRKVQDERFIRQMKEHVAYGESLGVTDVSGLFEVCNIAHQGGSAAVKRVLAKTQKPYTAETIYSALCTDTVPNQVGCYKSRQQKVIQWLREYLPKATINSSTTVVNKGSDNMSKFTNVNQAIDAVVNLAINEVGYTEKDSPSYINDKTGHSGSSNYTKYNKEMHDLQPRNMDYPAAWCDAFVDWLFYKTFGTDLGRKILCGDFDDYTFSSVNYYKNAGKWTSSPARGHQIFFGGSGHTGLVYEVKDGRVYTIEGNSNNAVRYRDYPIGYSTIIGYGIPKYELAVGTSANSSVVNEEVNGVFRQGSSGEEVRLMQKMLIACGYSCGSYGQDGDWGSATSSAVINFRNAHGLSADAVYDDKMRTILQKAYSSIQEPEFQGGGKAEVDPADVITTDVFPKSMYIIKSPGKLRESAKKAGTLIMNIPAKEKVKVIKEKTNSAGNVWCKSQYTTGGKTYTGWIVKSNLTEKKPS